MINDLFPHGLDSVDVRLVSDNIWESFGAHLEGYVSRNVRISDKNRRNYAD